MGIKEIETIVQGILDEYTKDGTILEESKSKELDKKLEEALKPFGLKATFNYETEIIEIGPDA